MMTREIAALRIGRSLNSVEDGLDTLIAEAGALLGTVTQARIATGAPASEGHRAIARLAALQNRLVEARGDVVRAHADLKKIAETSDIPTECPDMATLETMPERAVA
jgi:hypothetical protein